MACHAGPEVETKRKGDAYGWKEKDRKGLEMDKKGKWIDKEKMEKEMNGKSWWEVIGGEGN